MTLRGLPALDCFALQDVAGRARRNRVGHEDDHLPFAVRAKTLLASVLVFNLKDVSVRTFNTNTHGRPASRTTLEEDSRSTENGDGRIDSRTTIGPLLVTPQTLTGEHY